MARFCLQTATYFVEEQVRKLRVNAAYKICWDICVGHFHSEYINLIVYNAQTPQYRYAANGKCAAAFEMHQVHGNG